MQKHILTLLLVLLSAGIFAQDARLAGQKIEGADNERVDRTLERYAIFQINTDELLEAAQRRTASLALNIELENFPALRADLQPSDLLSDNLAGLAVYPYKGVSDEKNGGEAAFTFAKDYLYGLYEVDGDTYFIEPLWYYDRTQPRDLFVVYSSSDVRERALQDCAPVEIGQQRGALNSSADSPGPNVCRYMLEIAVANDLRMFEKFGSVANVKTHNIAVLNAAQVNYDDDFSKPIRFNVVAIFVPTTDAMDPITPTQMERGALLTEFSTWAEAGGFGSGVTYDIAHWRTTRPMVNPAGQGVNGAAFQLPGGGPTVCTNLKYAVFAEREVLSACELKRVTSHETGHLFGASHTSGTSNIMRSPSLGCTDTWAAISIQEIDAAIANATCLSPCTVPSYVNLPDVLRLLCTDVEACYTFEGNNCIATFSVYTTDPGLYITVNGQTICITNLYYFGPRKARVLVTPLDHCGQPSTEGLAVWWELYIDSPEKFCYGRPGSDVVDRAPAPAQTASWTPDDFTFSNPAMGVVRFFQPIPSGEVQLYSVQGTLLKSVQMNGGNELDVSDVPAGPYILTLKTAGKVISKRLLIHANK